MSQRTKFRIYVTHVDGDGPFLKLSGQLDKQSACIIESLIESARQNFDNGIGAVSPASITEGVVYAAKYKDGAYYRAKVLSTADLTLGLVHVLFIDYGNKDVISMSTIRFLDHPLLRQLRSQASDYYLSKIIQTSARWEELVLLKLQSLLCNSEYPAIVEAHTSTLPIISVEYQGTDLSQYISANRYGILVPVPKQESLVMKYATEVSQQILLKLQEKIYREPSNTYTEHVPFIENQTLPSNSASAMQLQQNMACSGNYVQEIVPPSLKTYEKRLLDLYTTYRVFVSYAEEGPEGFAVQLASDVKRLEALTDEINSQPHRYLQKTPMIGTVCLGRMSNDGMICRAIITSISAQQCQLFFVDFGYSELVSYYDMYDIPEKYIEPYVFSMKFRLSQVKKLPKIAYIKDLFKQMVTNKLLTLRVVKPEAPPLSQYGALFLEGQSVFDLLQELILDPPKFKLSQVLAVGSKCPVLVSYIDSCSKFFIQLSDKLDDLNEVMEGVKRHCESTNSVGQLTVGSACCAKFPNDRNWYRATVIGNSGNKIKVSYIDYGNEQDINESDIRYITPDLMKLPAQALKCALRGYQDKPVETETTNLFEMLTLENTLMAHVAGIVSDIMLVSLVDESVNPPLDIARQMNQLTQPRSSQESKPPTRKDPRANQFSSPSSVTDDREEGFRREESSQHSRGSRYGNDDFGQRGGSFRRDSEVNDDDDEWGINATENQNRSSDNQQNRFGRRENFGDRRRDNRRDRRPPRTDFNPRERAVRGFGSDGCRERSGRAPSYEPRTKFTQVQYKELPNPVPLETPFEEYQIEPNAQHDVYVTWMISPDSFYTQILSLQTKFVEMMHKLPVIYKGVKPFSGNIPVGASVLARYPKDGVLYRATVISVQPLAKFIVQYIDFGNKFMINACDIWQLDRELMELPKMAVHCSLIGVAPKDGEWKASSDIDLCFNAPRYQCVFQENVDGKFNVWLWNNNASVADMLVEKELGVAFDQETSLTLKDEPIDMFILIGQQINCRVTHVESFNMFYVQLDLEKAASVEETISNFDINLLTPLSADSLKDGVHCTVRHEGKIYRAILNDTSQTNDIKAVLPDYGIKINTSLENLMILPSKLSVYVYQSLVCRLNNYTEESEKLVSLDELKERLINNKFIIFINDVDETTLVTTLYDSTTGAKISIFTPDEGAYDEVSPLCARAVYQNNCGLAYVTHVQSLSEIYLQRAADTDKLAMLLDELFKFYGEGTPEPLTEFNPDGLCAALSSDGNWYRAIIISCTENVCTVQFPDYGNTEAIAKESTKKLDPKFYEPCIFAIIVSLGLEAISDDALTKFTEWTNNKEVQVSVNFGDNGWLASLYLDGVDLAVKLINEGLVASKPAVEAHNEIELIEEPVSLPPGCTKVHISHIDTPGHFWLQMADKVDAIAKIQAELQEKADNYENFENKDIGVLCVAKHLVDDMWYRAEILDADADITTVRFIDYGNTDVLNNVPELLKVLPDHLKDIEAYAVKASINAVPTGKGQWSETSADCFTQLVGDIAEPADALIVLNDVMTYVDIYVKGQNLTDKLVEQGHATRTEITQVGGDLPSCFASHVNSPSEFWIQLETDKSELQTIEDSMVDAENFPELKENKEGVICAAKYMEDGAWYRAQVIVDGSEGTEVLFIDYGNVTIATELRSLPKDLKIRPALSRKCALQKQRDSKAWSQKSEIKFNELAAEGATIFNVQFIASGNISIVELFINGKSVTKELFELCEEHQETEKPAPFRRGENVVAEQLTSSETELSGNVNQVCTSEPLADIGANPVAKELSSNLEEICEPDAINEFNDEKKNLNLLPPTKS